MLESLTYQGFSMQQDPQLEIASRLLAAVMPLKDTTELSDRLQYVDHSLDVAGALIARRWPQDPPAYDHAPPVRERVVLRDLGELLNERRARQGNGDASPASTPKKGPTLH